MTNISDMVKSFQQEVTGRIGTSLMKPLLATIGNPVDESVFATDTNRAAETEVYIHLLTSDDPTSYTTALRGSFTKKDIFYGRPVLVTINDAGDYVLDKVDSNRDAVYSVGIDNLDDQAPVFNRQLMELVTMHPIAGSLQFRATEGMLGGDWFSGLASADFSTGTVQDTTPANIGIPTTNGQAKGVLVQVDSITGVFEYKQSSEFSAILSMAQAYKAALLPLPDTDKYRLGYLKLVKGITEFSYDHIWNVPELLSKGASFTDFLIAADTGTPETVADGETVTVTGGTGIDTVVSATNTVTVAIDSTVATLTGAQTLANKVLSQLRLLLGGFLAIFTHSNTADRTYTLPDYDGTLATLAGTETHTNKTLTTPTIGSFANATHNHTNAAGGGQITDAALSAAVGIAKGGTGQTTQTAAMDALSPTTTKGDLLVNNGTNVIRLAVGVTNGHVLTVDSAEATGLKYAAAGGGITKSVTNGTYTPGSTYSTTSGTMVDVDATNVAPTHTTNGSGVTVVVFTFRTNKLTAGNAFYRVTNGTVHSNEIPQRFVTNNDQTTTCYAVFDGLSAGVQTFKLQYRSSDANAVQIITSLPITWNIFEVS